MRKIKVSETRRKAPGKPRLVSKNQGDLALQRLHRCNVHVGVQLSIEHELTCFECSHKTFRKTETQMVDISTDRLLENPQKSAAVSDLTFSLIDQKMPF